MDVALAAFGPALNGLDGEAAGRACGEAEDRGLAGLGGPFDIVAVEVQNDLTVAAYGENDVLALFRAQRALTHHFASLDLGLELRLGGGGRGKGGNEH